ncbi:MAG: DUF4363 family protein [Christensenellales bacterium]|jgi:hypothetical protein
MRTIIALALLALIIAVGVYEQVFINNVFEEMNVEVNEIRELISNENKSDALMKTKELIKWWDSKSQILEMMSPHASIKDFSIQLSTLRGQLERDDLEQAAVTCYVIQGLCDSAPHFLGFHVEHIF